MVRADCVFGGNVNVNVKLGLKQKPLIPFYNPGQFPCQPSISGSNNLPSYGHHTSYIIPTPLISIFILQKSRFTTWDFNKNPRWHTIQYITLQRYRYRCRSHWHWHIPRPAFCVVYRSSSSSAYPVMAKSHCGKLLLLLYATQSRAPSPS